MQTKNRGGDVLARGGVRANFPATDGGVTEDKWKNIFDSFDPEAYKNAPNPAQVRSSDAGSETSGDAGAGVGESGPSEVNPI